ncbi:MAG: CDP-alcohol phosphatidyltransferase family protein [Pseudomonadota bacterium]
MSSSHTQISSTRTAQASHYGRPLAIEEASNRFIIHPLSDFVVKLGVALKLSPNMVSLSGLLCGGAAAYFYSHLPRTDLMIAGFACMLGWHILDGADGRLARLTGQTSAFGRIIDGICDHLVFGAIYIVLGLKLVEAGDPQSIWLLIVAAALSHAVQAAGYEERRQKYQRRMRGQDRADTQSKLLVVDGKRSFWAMFYEGMQRIVSGSQTGLSQHLSNLRASGSDGADQAEALVSKTALMVRAWGLLNANNRTFLIFVFALLGQPLYYFLLEVIGFNLLLLVLIAAESHQERALIKQIAA